MKRGNAFITTLEGNERIVAEQLVYRLKGSLAEICSILSQSLQG